MKTELLIDPLTIKRELQTKLGHDIEREVLGIAAAEAMSALIAEKWAGKKVNKRILDQWKAKFAPDPDAQKLINASLEYIGGMCNLCFYGIAPAKEFNSRMRLFLGYENDHYSTKGQADISRSYNNLTVPGFEENNICCLSAAKERQANRRELIQSGELEKIAHAISEANRTRAELLEMFKYGEPADQVRYDAQRLIGMD